MKNLPQNNGVQPRQALAAQPSQPVAFSTLLADAAGQDDAGGIDLRAIWLTLKRHKITILLVFLSVFIINALGALGKTPIYQATITLELRPEEQRVLNFGVEAQGMADYMAASLFYQTQYELLRSRTLAEQVIDRMGLESRFAQANAPVIPVAQPFYAETLAAVKQTLRSWRDALLPTTPDEPKNAEVVNNTESEGETENPAVSRFMGSRKIEPVEESQVVTVTYDDADPKLAAAIANGIADTYINMSLERRTASTRHAEKFLQEQLVQAKSKLETAETELVQYAEKKAIYNLGDKQPLIAQQLNSANEALMEARKERIAAESAYQQAQLSSVQTKAQTNPALDALKQSLTKLQVEYQEKSGIYDDGYPVMQELRNQMTLLENNIQQEIQSETQVASTTLKANYLAAKQKEDQLQADVKQYKVDLLSNQNSGIGYNTLQREVEISRGLYEALLQRVKEVSVAGLATTSNVAVVDSALIPSSPYKPDTRKDLLSGALLGLVLGIAVAFLWEYLDDRVKVFEELERHVGNVPLLGILPALHRKQLDGHNYALLTQQKPASAVAEASRSLCTNLMLATRSGMPRLLNITSTEAAEGKTATAINLATAFAQTGKRVLLIDADLRKPTIHKHLKIANIKGFSHYLIGQENLQSLIQPCLLDGVEVITAGPPAPNPVELLHSLRMAELRAFAYAPACPFDVIILDSPPVLGLADALIIGHNTQATLMVVATKQVRMRNLKTAINRLNQAQANVIGITMSKNPQDSHDSYHYHYGDAASLPPKETVSR
ncbi:MAG: polysaccharide biosynthesis tyrosine autokinase [Candidatus Thiothrix putei]|uniref:non-specific protein-tyrosine kinase n=1 Tax=Candidatus Thiothrix putei TaxID=3080811 RepID=A0AA95HLJ4_9GAMM|nr:MAG: polysaccharide biosynthesis tyrosine autokinase [Candidatus Thiothrix putei]